MRAITVSVLALFSTAATAGEISGKVTTAKGGAGILVYVVNVPGTYPVPSQPAVMDQIHMEFVPFILPVMAGGTVEFKNSDKVVHNVYSPPPNGYNLPPFPTGQSRTHEFKDPGVYPQLCSLHPEMEAYVVALQNPYYAMTTADGTFVIKDIPNGSYFVRAIGKPIKKKDRTKDFQVTVSGKGTVDLSF
jgi:plastocyanin